MVELILVGLLAVVRAVDQTEQGINQHAANLGVPVLLAIAVAAARDGLIRLPAD